jgi:hypothetical protein
MEDFLLNTIHGNILLGVFVSIAAVGIVFGIQQLRYFFKIRTRIDKKSYNVYYRDDLDTPVFNVNCTTKGRTIEFSGKKCEDETNYYGEIILNLIDLRMGEGYYHHPAYNNGFSFMKVILDRKDQTFYIESPFVFAQDIYDKEGNKFINGLLIYQAYIWKQIE